MVEQEILRFDSLADPEQWIDNKRRPDCSMCFKKFSAFKRKYHCRLCGDIMCSTCYVKRRAELPMVGVITIKICSACANDQPTRKLEQSGSSASTKTNSVRLSTHSGGRQSRASAVSSQATSNSIASYIAHEITSKRVDKDKSHPYSDSMASESDMTYTSSVYSEDDRLNSLSVDLQGLSCHEAELPEGESVDEGIEVLRGISQLRVLWLREEDLEDFLELRVDEHFEYVAVRHRNQKTLVAKRLRGDRFTPDQQRMIDELTLMSQVRHPRIVELIGVSWTPDRRLQALYQHYPQGDLRAFLDTTARDRRNQDQRRRQKLQAALDLAEALSYLHTSTTPIIHGALTSRQVLIADDGRAKLCGIGCDSEEKRSRRWLAPEVLRGEVRRHMAADVYALGVILCELDTNELPYCDCMTPEGETLPESEIETMIMNGELQPTISRCCPPELRGIVVDCLAFDPVKRPSALEITVRLRMFIRSNGLEADREANKGIVVGTA